MTKQRPRPVPLKWRPPRSVPLDVHGSTKPSTRGYRCHASGGVGCVPFSGLSSLRAPCSSVFAFACRKGGEPSAFVGQPYARLTWQYGDGRSMLRRVHRRSRAQRRGRRTNQPTGYAAHSSLSVYMRAECHLPGAVHADPVAKHAFVDGDARSTMRRRGERCLRFAPSTQGVRYSLHAAPDCHQPQLPR